ncbi:hypothetical protein [Streptomyces sp. NPDC001401]|uniref:hypothetical protein n=1 Tax=Streptomyces sp. NPDC001401 TaxID=3364570 RepID=UPI003674A42D
MTDTLPTGRRQAVGVVVFGGLTIGLLLLTVAGYVVAAARLGLIGHPQKTQAQVCFYEPAEKTYRGRAAHYDCTAYLAHGTVPITYDSRPGQRVEVAKEPWGGWVPVEENVWSRVWWVSMPLFPMAAAALSGRAAVRSAARYRRFRGWRNSSLLPTGSCE